MAVISNQDFVEMFSKLKENKNNKEVFNEVEQEIISLVKSCRVNVNAVDNSGRSVLAICAREGFNNIGKELLRNGADANLVCNCNGKKLTALMFAISEDHYDMVEALITYNADVNFKDTYGNTPLMFAVNYSAEDVVSILVAAGADVNAQNGEGETALYQAVDQDDKGFAKILLANGADATIKNKNGVSAEDLVNAQVKKHAGKYNQTPWLNLKKEITNAGILKSALKRRSIEI